MVILTLIKEVGLLYPEAVILLDKDQLRSVVFLHNIHKKCIVLLITPNPEKYERMR